MECLGLLVLLSGVLLARSTEGQGDQLTQSEACSFEKQKSFHQYLTCIAANRRRVKRQLMYFYNGPYGHPCYGAVRMYNTERFVENVISRDKDSPICDQTLVTRWYRFMGPTGGVMPESCVPENSCGTYHPVWLNGRHPTRFGQPEDMEVCANVHNNCCARRWYTRVANCGDFFTYLLSATPGCFYAYCMGDGQRCPNGTSSLTGYTPGCTNDFPPLPGQVYLRLGEEPGTFQCEYAGSIPADSNIFVEWFIDAHEKSGRGDSGKFAVWRETMRWGRIRSVLREGYLMNRLGSSVYCQMHATFINNSGVPSPRLESNKYFAGIKILDRIVNISESGDTAMLRLQSTLPVFCLPGETCKVTLEMAFNPDYTTKRCVDGEIQEVVFGDCQLEFTPENWWQVQHVPVRAVRDFYTDGNKAMTLDFLPISSTASGGMWNRYRLPNVQVLTSDTPTKMCASIGDPHFNTFDGLNYHVYLEGEFVMYKSTKLPLQVNVRLQKCGRHKRISCNCAIAVLAADDVIVIDKCERRNRKLAYGPSFEKGWNTIHRHALQQGTTFTEGLQIYEYDEGRRFTVHMPTGAFLDFHVGKRWINVFLYASSDDWQSTLGLCGTFDGDLTNDFKHPDGVKQNTATKDGACGDSIEVCEFAKSWRVPTTDSFFGTELNITLPDNTFDSESKFCRCENNRGRHEIVCNYHQDVQNCQSDTRRRRGVDKTLDILLPTSLTGKPHTSKSDEAKPRKRRSIPDVEEVDEDVSDYFKSQFLFDEEFIGQEPDWSESGISEQYAERHCRRIIMRSRLGAVCRTYIREKIDTIIKACKTDIKITGDLWWSMSSLDSMVTDCEHAIHTKASLWTGQRARGAPGETNADMLLNIVCPNDCSRKGFCRSGTCICKRGFTGTDCSLPIRVRPMIDHLSGDGVCDRARRPCRRLVVRGRGFRNDNLKCLFRKENGDVIQSDARLETFEEIFCLVPESNVTEQGDPDQGPGSPYQVLYISVQQGLVQSNEKSYVVYNSYCYECRTNGVGHECLPRDYSCIVNGHCYAPEQEHPHDCCFQCNPLKSKQLLTGTGILLRPLQRTYFLAPGKALDLRVSANKSTWCGSTISYDATVDSQNDALSVRAGLAGVDVSLQATEVGAHYVTVFTSHPCVDTASETYNIFVVTDDELINRTGQRPLERYKRNRNNCNFACIVNRSPYFTVAGMELKTKPNEIIVVKLPAEDMDKEDKLTFFAQKAVGKVTISDEGVMKYQAGPGTYTDDFKVVVKDCCHSLAYLQLTMSVN